MSTEPLLLIPGLNCTARLYSAQVAALGARRTVAVADHTGAATMADVATAILADAPPRFALAGLSMGGYIAFEMWRQAPSRVARLALLDTQARPDTEDAKEMRRRTIDVARDRFDTIPDLQIPRLLADESLANSAFTDVVRQMSAETGPDAFIRQMTAIIDRIDSRPTLSSISVPTLVLVGAGDKITPPDLAREMADGIAGAELVVIPGAGHLPTIEAPDAATEALKAWLART
jgi:pimeloyl-ACP methyl ester carboxylesterase